MSTKIYIYDCNNYVRIKSETSFSGSFIRELINEANRDSDEVIKFYVFDGNNSNAYRRQFYPEYKLTRKPPIDNFFENLKWFKELLGFAKSNVCTIQVDGCEADDVIAEIATWFPSVTIFSTDKDLLQIQNATLPMANNDWEKRDLIFARKVLCGDSSDNIKGIKGFGETTWKNMSNESKYLAKVWVEKGSAECKKIFADSLATRAKNVILGASDEEIEMLKKVVGFRKVNREDVKLSFGANNLSEIERQLCEYGL